MNVASAQIRTASQPANIYAVATHSITAPRFWIVTRVCQQKTFALRPLDFNQRTGSAVPLSGHDSHRQKKNSKRDNRSQSSSTAKSVMSPSLVTDSFIEMR